MTSSIIAENLSVEYPIIGASRSFRTEFLVNKVGGLIRRPGSAESTSNSIVVQALRDINLNIVEGAGKSTLLRTLAGRYLPTAGRVETVGKVLPLLALGVGMDGDFTGFENIKLSGLYLGMSHKEIAAVATEVAEFTELGDFLNLPLRTYSAGMQLRLAFGIATAFHLDILLVDEVFGAGDATFYDKAKKRMEAMLERSGIFVLASHGLGLVEHYCNKTAVLEKGSIAFFGPTKDAVAFYQEHVRAAG
jgi:ABC-2 type transport system ATP-binding protein